jgi:periplasmic copper chaperone A
MKKIMILAALACTFTCAAAYADISIKNQWVRATVPQQPATGAFMQITSTTDVRLVAANSPVASRLEIHEMKMDGDIMKMRELDGLNIPAGQSIDLIPGSYHIMFMGLKKQVKEGEEVPIQLVFEHKDLRKETIDINAVVKPLNASAGKPKVNHGN